MYVEMQMSGCDVESNCSVFCVFNSTQAVAILSG